MCPIRLVERDFSFWLDRRKRLQSIQDCFLNPALEALKSAISAQSNESYEFQCTVFKKVKKGLQHYLHRNYGFVKHQLFMRRPGSGETLLCTMLFSQAVPKGLNCSIMCLSGERAKQLRGEHIHEMIKFRMNKDVHPDLMPSQRITSLLKM